MSFNEVLAELPTLTPAQRLEIMRCALELDESPLSAEHEVLVEERLAAHRRCRFARRNGGPPALALLKMKWWAPAWNSTGRRPGCFM
jgi:hypothetical protein